MKFFNTAGPNQPDIHYTLSPLSRWNLPEITGLIEARKFFVLHAPRQTGKTTGLLALRDHLNKEGKYSALYVNIEAAQAARENVQRGIQAVLASFARKHRELTKETLIEDKWKEILDKSGPESALSDVLSFWAQNSDKPTVLFIDEIDALVGDTLISVLRQIRAGYADRPASFPQSILLCGVRDVRDYRIHSSSTKEIITGGSAFNIKSESLRLGNFTQEDIRTLYHLHSEHTGQKFEEEIFPLVWKHTEGQPWLVNALAYEACFKIEGGKDRTKSIDANLIREAKENLVVRRDTHLDQLIDKLQEDRVKRVIQPILKGDEDFDRVHPDDIQYCIDLGLIKRQGNIKISNSIYSEVIPRELSFTQQVMLVQESLWYVDSENRIQYSKLLKAFQDFFRKNSEIWIERFEYKEAGPQLLLQAFLQRILNGEGTIEREYGLGTKRTDLHITWFPNGRKNYSVRQESVMELKILHESLDYTIAEGLKQVATYYDKCGAEEAHLLIFNRSPEVKWEEKIFYQEKEHEGVKVGVWGM
jgi:hypothetical protein